MKALETMIQTNSYLRIGKEFLHSPITWVRDRPVLASGALFFASTTLVNLGNYIFNLVLGRWLGPAQFADLSLVITLMLVITFATTAFATTTAKFVASSVAIGDMSHLAALRAWLTQKALALGMLLCLLFVLGAPFLKTIFHMHSFWPFVGLGIGLPLFFVLSIERGVLQGQARFTRLALSNQAEMWIRLFAAIGFVAIGWSVNGAVVALPLSFVAAWFCAFGAGKGFPSQFQPLSPVEKANVMRYVVPVIMGLIGQIVINNSDILIVKGFFSAREAGQYAALALIGRMVFFATWSVVMVMFPVVTQKHQKGEAHRFLLWSSVGIIALVSGVILVVAMTVPELAVTLLFGKEYLPIAPLLWLYALATAFYALANVFVNYYLSLGNGQGSYLVLLAGIAQVVGLLLWHNTLFTVVIVQVWIMAGLLIILGIWDRCGKKVS